jgi:hypothetical protein
LPDSTFRTDAAAPHPGVKVRQQLVSNCLERKSPG